jgi:hypothetical protein
MGCLRRWVRPLAKCEHERISNPSRGSTSSRSSFSRKNQPDNQGMKETGSLRKGEFPRRKLVRVRRNRIERTARLMRRGKKVSFVTQHSHCVGQITLLPLERGRSLVGVRSPASIESTRQAPAMTSCVSNGLSRGMAAPGRSGCAKPLTNVASEITSAEAETSDPADGMRAPSRAGAPAHRRAGDG